MRLPVAILLIAVAFGGQALPQASPTTRLVGVNDLFGRREVQHPQITRHGRYSAYTVLSTLLKDDKSQTRIWMVPTADGEAV